MKRFNETYGKRKFLSRNEWADTYKAIHSKTEEKVIVKVLVNKSNDEEYIKNLSNEIKVIKEISNDNLIHINDMFQYVAYGKTYYYIESEYFKGITLKEKISNEKLDEKEAIKIVKDIATGLNELHYRNLLFNRLSTENILINSNDTVKLDILSYLENKEFIQNTEEEEIIFSPRKDIHDLGIILYTLLSGKTVFEKNKYKKDIKNNNLYIVIEKAINEANENKYKNLDRLIADLQSYLSCGEIIEDTFDCEEKVVKHKRKKGNLKKIITPCIAIALITGAGAYAYDFVKNNPIEINNIFKIEKNNSKSEENKDDEKIKSKKEKKEKNENDIINENSEKSEEKNNSSEDSIISNKEEKNSSNNTVNPNNVTTNNTNESTTNNINENITTPNDNTSNDIITDNENTSDSENKPESEVEQTTPDNIQPSENSNSNNENNVVDSSATEEQIPTE